jgi:translation elongation factor EF-G
VSASPEKFADLLGASVATSAEPDCDAAIFIINPSAGIDNETIAIWRDFDEYQTPRLVLVTVLEGMELDFDDAVLLANRVFDPLVTPYLVLHGESGTPVGTISLDDLSTKDYSTSPPEIGTADEELTELVRDFREEYLELMMEMEEGAFGAGILFPALPVNTANGLGIDLVTKYLSELPSSS